MPSICPYLNNKQAPYCEHILDGIKICYAYLCLIDVAVNCVHGILH